MLLSTMIPAFAEVNGGLLSDSPDALPSYLSVSGTVTEVEERGDGVLLVLDVAFADTDERGVAHINVGKDTVLTVAGSELDSIAVGDVVVAWYYAHSPMILIYPPQYNAVVLTVNPPDDHFVVVDTFVIEGTHLLSKGGLLTVVSTNGVEVVKQDGTPFSGELSGLDLVVTYAVSTRSIPPQTTPSRIVVLQSDPSEPVEVPIGLLPAYQSVSGNVVDIIERADGGTLLVLEQFFSETNQTGTAHVNVYYNTVFTVSGSSEKAIAVGDDVTAWYNARLPMPMIYPPRYNAVALAVNKPDDHFVVVDTFFDSESFLLSEGNSLAIVSTVGTEILRYNGLSYSGILSGRDLVVVYSASTRSIPPQTTPSHIFVLPGVLEKEPRSDLPTASAPYFVNDKVIDAAPAFIIDDTFVMVPLRAIAEAAGLEVLWDADTAGVTVGGTINLWVGNPVCMVNGSSVELTKTPVLVNSLTYVPLSFFRTAVGMSNAYYFEGEIVVNNGVPMEG